MIQGIIFDLDGVICSTDKYHYIAWKEIADKLNIAFDEKVNDRLRGVSRMRSLEIILENSNQAFTQNEKDILASEKNEIYRKCLTKMNNSDLSDEVKHTLKKLRGYGLKLAIGSSSKNAETILRQIGLENFFDVVSDGNNITRSKPDPEVFLYAADKLGLSPDSCFVVEDAIAGIHAATAGGFKSVAFGAAVAETPADYHIQRFSDLLNLL